MRMKIIAIALFLAAAGSVAQAQPSPFPKAPEEPKISVSFKGGTVQEYLAALRAAGSKEAPVNAVVSKELYSVQIPPVELSDTTVYAALSALTVLVPRNEYELSVKPLSQMGLPQYHPNAFAVEAQRRFSSPDQMPQSLRIYSVRDLLAAPGEAEGERVSSATLLTALRTALGEVPGAGDPPPEVKFHAESGLLIVRATEIEQDTVKQVVREVGASVKNDAVARRAAAARKLDLARGEQRVLLSQRVIENLRNRLESARKMQEAGTVPAGEVQNLQLEYNRAETELAMAQAERQAVLEGVILTNLGADTAELVERIARLEQAFAQMQNANAQRNVPARGGAR